MMKKMNYFKKVIGSVFMGLTLFCAYDMFNEVIRDEAEDFIHDMSPAAIEDGTYFNGEDFLLGTISTLTMTYSIIKTGENLFRKEDKKES